LGVPGAGVEALDLDDDRATGSLGRLRLQTAGKIGIDIEQACAAHCCVGFLAWFWAPETPFKDGELIAPARATIESKPPRRWPACSTRREKRDGRHSSG
jgi:hypothetical protein